MDHWHWPQWTMAILMTIGVVISPMRLGRAEANWQAAFIYLLITFLCYAGGFWNKP